MFVIDERCTSAQMYQPGNQPMRKLLLLLSLILSFPLAALAGRTEDVGTGVAALAPLLSDGSATLDPASVHVYSEGNRSAAVFTMEAAGGGPGSWQFVAFFETNESLPDQAPARSAQRLLAFLQVGDRGGRMFDSSSGIFAAGRLVLSGAAHARGDATCCPSRPLRSAFSVEGGRVVERVLSPRSSPGPSARGRGAD